MISTLRKWYKWLLKKLFWGGFHRFLPDEQYIKFRYWLAFDQSLNLKAPKKFSEKIQYIKLFQRNELRKLVADRTKVRDYVSSKIGEPYLIPLIDIYDELTPKVWQSLPEQFVLKANHGSGMIYISRKKSSEDFVKVHHQTEKWKKFDYAKYGREWAYKGIPRTLVAEHLMLNSDGEIPKDFKFFCFNGQVKLIQIDFNRFKNQRRNLYDRDFNQIKGTLFHPNYKGRIKRPPQMEKAIKLAEALSKDFNFIRVDLYLLDNDIYFGELTNYPGNGFEQFKPDTLDLKMGSYLKL